MAYLVESFSLVFHHRFGWDDGLCQVFFNGFVCMFLCVRLC
jgi:hypothetical protein